MIHARPRGSKVLVVKMDERTNRHFYKNCFYVWTENIVADPTGFPERENFARKSLSLINRMLKFFGYFLFFVVGTDSLCYSIAEKFPCRL